MFNPIFRGFILNQAQLDAIVPLINGEMGSARERSREDLESEAEALFKAAGCEVNESNNQRAATETVQSRSKE